MNSCYSCRYLLQSGDGENACVKFPDPEHSQYPHPLDDRPEPLYDDCFERIKEVLGA